jgi:hypothetical protein
MKQGTLNRITHREMRLTYELSDGTHFQMGSHYTEPQHVELFQMLAAAPEMLAALEKIISLYPVESIHTEIKQARQAVANARGVK